jgi:hypothetical protein
MPRKNHIEHLHRVIEHLHCCDAIHVEAVPLDLDTVSATVWTGMIDIFELIGHPRAQRCYAWLLPNQSTGRGSKVVTVLELPPVVSAETAVKIFMANRSEMTPS